MWRRSMGKEKRSNATTFRKGRGSNEDRHRLYERPHDGNSKHVRYQLKAIPIVKGFSLVSDELICGSLRPRRKSSSTRSLTAG